MVCGPEERLARLRKRATPAMARAIVAPPRPQATFVPVLVDDEVPPKSGGAAPRRTRVKYTSWALVSAVAFRVSSQAT